MATDTTKPVAPELWPEGRWTTNPRVTMATSLGNVVVELQPNSAPLTVVNFLAYTNTGFYKSLLFHRVIPGFVAQGGGYFRLKLAPKNLKPVKLATVKPVPSRYSQIILCLRDNTTITSSPHLHNTKRESARMRP